MFQNNIENVNNDYVIRIDDNNSNSSENNSKHFLTKFLRITFKILFDIKNVKLSV